MLETVLRTTPVLGSRTVTAAPEIAAPDWSKTLPDRDPRTDCAKATSDGKKVPSKAEIVQIPTSTVIIQLNFFIMLPPGS